MWTYRLRNALYSLNALSPVVLALPVALLITGCGSSSSGSNVTSETLALGSSAKNVELIAGAPITRKFTYTYPGDITSRGDYSINMIETLSNVTLSSAPIAGNGSIFETLRLLALGAIKQAFAAEQPAQVVVHISYAGDPDVCNSPYIGQDTILGAVGSPPTGNVSTAQLTQEAKDIINAGAFELCVVTTPPVSGYVTVPGVVVDFESCEAPATDITGTWSGTYQCSNFGTTNPTEGGDIILTITQNTDGSYHYDDDGGASYDGHLCGSKFRFNGGVDTEYTENGTLVFNGTSATKSSHWVSVSLTSGGTCSDVLQKDI